MGARNVPSDEEQHNENSQNEKRHAFPVAVVLNHGSYFSVENANTVSECIVSPGFSSVLGNAG
jgi:hypothetical protein